MKQIQVNKDGMLKLLKNLKPHKAAGQDGIPARIWPTSLSTDGYFQVITWCGELPMAWMDAVISPIYKKGDRNSAANYRPVSLTCVVYKILEHIIHCSVM